MQQQESFAAGRRTVTPIQPRDADDGDVEQRIVLRHALRRRVRPVGEQREVQLLIGRGEIVDLEPVQVFLDARARVQQHRHGDQCAQVLGNAFAQRQAGQAARADAASHGAIHQRDGDVHRRNGGEQAQQPQHWPVDAELLHQRRAAPPAAMPEVKAIAAT